MHGPEMHTHTQKGTSVMHGRAYTLLVRRFTEAHVYYKFITNLNTEALTRTVQSSEPPQPKGPFCCNWPATTHKPLNAEAHKLFHPCLPTFGQLAQRPYEQRTS